jgi:hypothetical protein
MGIRRTRPFADVRIFSTLWRGFPEPDIRARREKIFGQGRWCEPADQRAKGLFASPAAAHADLMAICDFDNMQVGALLVRVAVLTEWPLVSALLAKRLFRGSQATQSDLEESEALDLKEMMR